MKSTYYGKGDVIVYRLHRDGSAPVFGASVKMLIYGHAFWPTYTTGDNTGLIATDSMKNFIQRETMNYDGHDLEAYCHFIANKFLSTYPQAAGAKVSAVEIPYSPLSGTSLAYAPGGPERATARVELERDGSELRTVESRSGLTGFKLLRLTGSSFQGFVRDQYTTLPDIANRPLHMWLDLEWTAATMVTGEVRKLVHEVFVSFESGSIQQIVYQLGTRILADLPTLSEVKLEANNRTWDTIVEQGEDLGVYTDPRPPYGVIGLTMRR